jgi:hypothetical protein
MNMRKFWFCCFSALLCAAACSGAQDVSQVKHAAIVAGCEAALSDAGAAGDVQEIKTGCEASLRVWEQAP